MTEGFDEFEMEDFNKYPEYDSMENSNLENSIDSLRNDFFEMLNNETDLDLYKEKSDR